MEGQTWQRIALDIRSRFAIKQRILGHGCYTSHRLYCMFLEWRINLKTCPVEIWVMNATCNDTLFEIVGSWVVDLSQLDPASNLPSDGFDSGAISRELIWVQRACFPRTNYARRCTQFPILSPRILYQNHQDQIDPEPNKLFLLSVSTIQSLQPSWTASPIEALLNRFLTSTQRLR